ncbi:MAG: hypothetical protein M0P31_07175 [Solirubrobacteraceae bacterium]|nr:hypothetical protein [Solirubrobacteraceae bacterium]
MPSEPVLSSRRPARLRGGRPSGPLDATRDDPVPSVVAALRRWAPRVGGPLAAEVLASTTVGRWPARTPDPVVARYGTRTARRLLAAADPPALAALRALQLGGPDGVAPAAAAAAARLAAAGVAEPDWWPDPPATPRGGVGLVAPDAAWGADALRATGARVGHPADGSARRVVLVEFRGRGEPVHAVAAVIAPDGVATGLQIVGSLASFAAALPDDPDPAAMQLPDERPSDAARRIARALGATAGRGSDADRAACDELWGFVERRLATVAAGVEDPTPRERPRRDASR